MPNPHERLDQIIAAYVPSEVVFKATSVKGGAVSLTAVVTKPKELKELVEDKELQTALAKEIEEMWNADDGKYYVSATIEGLWRTIKHTILREYDNTSERCAATKRKTEAFIRDIKIDDKHLPNYLVQVFLKISSPSYEKMTRVECAALFEQFESLRRTYGKRDR